MCAHPNLVDISLQFRRKIRLTHCVHTRKRASDFYLYQIHFSFLISTLKSPTTKDLHEEILVGDQTVLVGDKAGNAGMSWCTALKAETQSRGINS